MTKQEFMAMSLPYGLKGVSNVNSICTLNSIDITDNEYGVRFGYEILTFTRTFFTPILRPLSDLTKEIEHKGETFIPVEKLGWGSYFSKSNVEMAIDNLSLHEALKLIEWHFDIAGLTDKNEAVDYHTLEGFSF